MDSAERFYSRLDKLKDSSPPINFKLAVEEVQRIFEEAMRVVPESLIEAIYLHFLDSYNHAELPDEKFVEYSYRLGPFIDLFWKRYDEKEDPIPKEDWVFLKEAVSEAAGEMDLELLSYIMQLLMNRKLI